jgi:uncharacterized OsmC-like protein
VAALHDITLEGLEFHIRGYFDRRGGRVPDVPNHGFEEIRYEVYIASPDTPDRIKALVEEAERHCYVLNTLRRAVKIHACVMLNGTLLRELESAPA